MSIGPSMPLRLEKPERIDLAQAARYFGARGGADAATQALLEKCAVPLLAAATPRAVWLEADPDSLTAAGGLAGGGGGPFGPPGAVPVRLPDAGGDSFG